ncbi:cytochrome P450 [Leucogyrophana mollusca]|uniref:Cytochrome P450 n=1 Tax=Leucogyrophana mollusca TaxID=85980 RepID=A0ACB8BI22_9AGAM|nr:cytochrome P450 [Leucogyrophana mollusca]
MVSSWTGVVLALLVFMVWRRTRRQSLNDIRGPVVPSRLFGHEKMARYSEEVGDLELQWGRAFGPTFRTQGCYGEEKLWTADPKALQHVFHTSGYRYPKGTLVTEVGKLFSGEGILSAAGDDHRRQRKIMNPAFSTGQLRAFLPVFRRSAARLSEKWKEELQITLPFGGRAINISPMLGRMALDVVGEAAFDDQFGALDGNENELARAFDSLFADSFLHPPPWDILFKATWRYLPPSVLGLIKYLPTKEYKRFRSYLRVAFRRGKELIEQKSSGAEKGSKDIMSILVQSNLSEDAETRLSEVEMLSQIATLLIAAHDSIANTLAWLLYELARHPEDQQKIRDEIIATRARIEARHSDDFTPADLDAMIFTNAVIKESLRLHPVAPVLVREAGYDDILPLAVPIQTKSGKATTEIPIASGTQITASVWTYNRLESVWGGDAAVWNPARFLDHKERTNVGVFANLMTFSAGIRGCIGWRFALLELQVVLTELIETFDFRIPKDVEIVGLNAGIMMPIVKGKLKEGVQVPLHLSVLR